VALVYIHNNGWWADVSNTELLSFFFFFFFFFFCLEQEEIKINRTKNDLKLAAAQVHIQPKTCLDLFNEVIVSRVCMCVLCHTKL
jgi:hypothetical protein